MFKPHWYKLKNDECFIFPVTQVKVLNDEGTFAIVKYIKLFKKTLFFFQSFDYHLVEADDVKDYIYGIEITSTSDDVEKIINKYFTDVGIAKIKSYVKEGKENYFFYKAKEYENSLIKIRKIFNKNIDRYIKRLHEVEKIPDSSLKYRFSALEYFYSFDKSCKNLENMLFEILDDIKVNKELK